MQKIKFYVYIADHAQGSNPKDVYYFVNKHFGELKFTREIGDAKWYDTLKEARACADIFGGRVVQYYEEVQ